MSTEPKKFEQKLIPLTDILLDLTNVRIGNQDSQAAAIEAMIRNQGDGLVNLAKHIGEQGLSPLESLGVVREKGRTERYTVTEGNRRITALKLLNNPSLAEGTEIETKIVKVAASAKVRLTEIPAVVFPSHADAKTWMNLKHLPGTKGVGVEKWTSIQIARSEGQIDRGLEMLALVLDQGELDDSDKELIAGINFPITNLRRLVNSPEVLELMGVRWENDRYIFIGEKSEALTLLSMMVSEIGKGKSVTTIKSLNQRIEYAHKLRELAGFASLRPNPPLPIPNPENGPLPSPTPPPTPPLRPKKRPLRPSNFRRKLIPSNFAVHIPELPRINEIFIELKKLRLPEHRNAIAVLFRVFLEFSVEQFIKRNNVVLPPPRVKSKPIKCSSCGTINQVPAAKNLYNHTFAEKVKEVQTFMQANGIMDKKEFGPLRKMLENPHAVVHPQNFNAFVHSKDMIPGEQELKDMWDMLQPFIEKLWP